MSSDYATHLICEHQTALDDYYRSHAYGLLCKAASDPVLAYSLAGRLYQSRSGWCLLSVPNAVMNGLFDALDETGAELPPSKDGRPNAHISVIRPEEIASIGGAAKISERGHTFRYTLGPVREVTPSGWPEMSKCWYVEVHSPELKSLRKSYGLSPLPNKDHEFHITFAVRRKGVLHNNSQSKIPVQESTSSTSPYLTHSR